MLANQTFLGGRQGYFLSYVVVVDLGSQFELIKYLALTCLFELLF